MGGNAPRTELYAWSKRLNDTPRTTSQIVIAYKSGILNVGTDGRSIGRSIGSKTTMVEGIIVSLRAMDRHALARAHAHEHADTRLQRELCRHFLHTNLILATVHGRGIERYKQNEELFSRRSSSISGESLRVFKWTSR